MSESPPRSSRDYNRDHKREEGREREYTRYRGEDVNDRNRDRREEREGEYDRRDRRDDRNDRTDGDRYRSRDDREERSERDGRNHREYDRRDHHSERDNRNDRRGDGRDDNHRRERSERDEREHSGSRDRREHSNEEGHERGNREYNREGKGRDDDHRKRMQQKQSLPIQLYSVHKGIVKSIQDYGAFVQFGEDGEEQGLIHISQFSFNRIEGKEDVKKILDVGDPVYVKVIDFNNDGKITLSYKYVDQMSGNDKDVNEIEWMKERNRHKGGERKGRGSNQPIHLEAVLQINCTRCGTKGHIASECFASQEGQAYSIISTPPRDSEPPQVHVQPPRERTEDLDLKKRKKEKKDKKDKKEKKDKKHKKEKKDKKDKKDKKHKKHKK
eukprot:TRINITY_DN4343_c0_g1_i1.p1 TRINITY_DN4343_c0_g1~~TRINITY_DN4343_c0_g1_i1.p1  ORF type:complete len:385 (+),score=154.92 TRINITY_DN4343_c0_g1_i1:80-1234(+)